jgi:hypothetical protein
MLPDVNGLLRAESNLHQFKCNLVNLNEKARNARQLREDALPLASARLDSFVTQVAGWAKARQISILSVNPEGSPMVVDAKVGEKSLGRWNAGKVVLQGKGQYEQVMDFANMFIATRMPVQMQAISLQSLDSGKSGEVAFQITFMLYEESKSG